MSGVGDMTIRNEGDADDWLLDVRSDAAVRVMAHVTTQINADVTQTRVAKIGIVLHPGGELLLAPKCMHTMFMGLTAPFTVSETIPVTLVFENAGAVDLPVKPD